MIVEVVLPKLGMYEGDARLVEWLVGDGEKIEVGAPLFLVETEKIETEVEADDPGLVVQMRSAGFEAPIGTLIGYIVSTPAEYEDVRGRGTE